MPCHASILSIKKKLENFFRVKKKKYSLVSRYARSSQKKKPDHAPVCDAMPSMREYVLYPNTVPYSPLFKTFFFVDQPAVHKCRQFNPTRKREIGMGREGGSKCLPTEVSSLSLSRFLFFFFDIGCSFRFLAFRLHFSSSSSFSSVCYPICFSRPRSRSFSAGIDDGTFSGSPDVSCP